uniref:Uncharacterized protein n=1 Tax=Plectus sambesii TaxID=2011161 RepID=A0A914WL93_9BILA
MKLIVLILITLTVSVTSQDATSETTVAPTLGVSDEVTTITASAPNATDASSEATTTASVSKSTTEEQATKAASDSTESATVTSVSETTISSSDCRDMTTLCLSYKQLCEVPERCRRPTKSGNSSSSSSSSDESDSAERDKSKHNRRARSTEVELDNDELACSWVRQGNETDLHEVAAECAAYAPQLELRKTNYGVDNSLKGGRGGRHGPKRPLLDCFFREVISKFFRRVCPVTCGTCHR